MILACVFVAVLLAIGFALRNRFGIFDKIYIPASVIAGTIGLAVIQLIPLFSLPESADRHFNASVETLVKWPGFLIAVVFAAMLLQRNSGRRRIGMRATVCEAIMVWIIALGQTAVGLLLTWLVIQPFYDVPNSFGMLIETGFAGGHGTAAAMGQVFTTPQIDFPVGRDLGLLMATVGLVYGTISGIFWINLILRLKLATIDKPETASLERGTIVNDESIAAGTKPDGAGNLSIASRYMIQILAIATAFAIGFSVQGIVGMVAVGLDQPEVVDISMPENESAASPVAQRLRWVSLVGSFPLFIYTLLGGWIVARVLRSIRRARWLDGHAGATISGWAMDLLVVAALATLNLQAVAAYLFPMTVLFLGGAVWCAVCLLFLSPRILAKSHWFELGLINYGMSTGTTATGFVLLRLVDPQLKTDAAKQYALAAPLSAPMVGGGLITIGLPLLVLQRVPIGVSAILLSAIVVGLIFVAIGLAKPTRTGQS
jgi:ESS family glutamate:Na+ symporter